MTCNESPEWDDDVPSADPQIQKEYEAALGKFLVAFNSIENIVNDTIYLALPAARREEISKKISDDNYNRKVLTLDLITSFSPHPANQALIQELGELGTERNHLAHGHFDQNPFDGSYHVVSKRKRLERPVEMLHRLTERAEKAFFQLRQLEAQFEFSNHDWEDEQTD